MHPPLFNETQSISRSTRWRPLSRRAHDDQNARFLNFALESIRKPISTGAVAPSSRFLVNKVIELAELHNAQSVVELGPGTGAFTEQIQHHVNDSASLFALELNESVVKTTRKRCPRVRVYHDAAENLPTYLANGALKCDRIITSLPWTIFEHHEQIHLLDTIASSLKPGGKFISIVYLGAKTRVRGRNFINSLPLHFKHVKRSNTEWRNIPPTQVYCCQN